MRKLRIAALTVGAHSPFLARDHCSREVKRINESRTIAFMAFANLFCRDSGKDCVGGNVVVDDAVSADHRTLADTAPGQNHSTGTDENIVGNDHLLTEALVHYPHAGLEIAGRSENGHVRTQAHEVADFDLLRPCGDMVKAADGAVASERYASPSCLDHSEWLDHRSLAKGDPTRKLNPRIATDQAAVLPKILK